jgi:hypothetical protein
MFSTFLQRKIWLHFTIENPTAECGAGKGQARGRECGGEERINRWSSRAIL